MLIPDIILGTHYRTEINIVDPDFFIPDLRSWIQQKHKRGAGKNSFWIRIFNILDRLEFMFFNTKNGF
jgi:hypothetical protein